MFTGLWAKLATLGVLVSTALGAVVAFLLKRSAEKDKDLVEGELEQVRRTQEDQYNARINGDHKIEQAKDYVVPDDPTKSGPIK